MRRLTLVTGGVRSGKSSFAQGLARAHVGPVAFVATARATDLEFARRIARHQRERPAGWTTIEEPLDLTGAVRTGWDQASCVLVDDLTLWTSHRLLATAADPKQTDWHDRVEELEQRLRVEIRSIHSEMPKDGQLVLVSQETGWGVVPPYPLGRAFRDLLGRVNQEVAARADNVYLVVAGLAVDIKQLAKAWPE